MEILGERFAGFRRDAAAAGDGVSFGIVLGCARTDSPAVDTRRSRPFCGARSCGGRRPPPGGARRTGGARRCA